MIMLSDAEKSSDKIQHTVIIKKNYQQNKIIKIKDKR